MKCKGIIAPERGRIIMTDVDVPEPLPNQVQVRMTRTMISPGTERAHILALPNANQVFPHITGYCCAGYVEKVGSDVQDFTPGDRVACFAVDVGHRQIGNVIASRVAHIPDSMPFEYAAFNVLAHTAMQGVRKCGIELGESVVVLGLGIVGQLCLQFARANGAIPAIGIDPMEQRRSIATACGADYVFDNKETPAKELIADATHGKGAQVVLDSTGFPAVLSEACGCAANYGRVCIVGCPRGLTEFNFYTLVQLKSLQIIGAHAVHSVPSDRSQPRLWTYQDDMACFNALVEKGVVQVEPLISDRIHWTEAVKAFEYLLSWGKDSLGVIINWED